MCGLSGSFSHTGTPDRSIAAAMHNALLHRGPDETYSFSTAQMSMKLARLGMNGLTDGWQPAQDSTGRYVAITNGEIYNSADLWDQALDARRSVNQVDVAIVPELFAQHGPMGLELIDGQFATVIFDQMTQTLHLGRDRFGICPLHYVLDRGHLHFCSELRPLVQYAPTSRRVDITAVDQYLSLGNIVAPRTIVEGVNAVPPGCVVRFDSSGTHTTQYWRYGKFQEDFTTPGGVRKVVRSAVASRLAAEVEIGAYLSGGLDSTILVAEAAQFKNTPLQTFSVAFQENKLLNEQRYQREVHTALGTNHHEIQCTPADIARQFEDMVRHCCYPQRETYNVASRMLSATTSEHRVKGVISGEGADELFFGYDSYAFDGAVGTPLQDNRNHQIWGRADFGWETNWEAREKVLQACLSTDALESLRGREFYGERLIPFEDDELTNLTRLQLRSICDVYIQLCGHLLGDHGDSMLMSNSVEGRYPFLANAVVEYALRTPDSAKVANFEGKQCLRTAYRSMIPPVVLDRPKQGFTAYPLDDLDPETTKRWRELVADCRLFSPDALASVPAHGTSKWDLTVSLTSLSILIDEMGLT